VKFTSSLEFDFTAKLFPVIQSIYSLYKGFSIGFQRYPTGGSGHHRVRREEVLGVIMIVEEGVTGLVVITAGFSETAKWEKGLKPNWRAGCAVWNADDRAELHGRYQLPDPAVRMTPLLPPTLPWWAALPSVAKWGAGASPSSTSRGSSTMGFPTL